MRLSFAIGPRLLTLIGATALITTPALARDVTVYGGGVSKTYTASSAETDRPARVIAGGQNRETAFDKRVQRFALERKIRILLENRETEADREISDAMLRIMLRGNKDARRQYSSYYPYYHRSANFYARLTQAMREQDAGIKVYRQSVLDDVSSEDLQRVAEALNDLK